MPIIELNNGVIKKWPIPATSKKNNCIITSQESFVKNIIMSIFN